MQKKYFLLSLFLVAVLATLNVSKVNSKISSPPAGSSGDSFTNATCAQSGCHAGPVQNSTSSNLTLKIGTGNPTTDLDNSFVYTPGQQYNIAFSILTAATTNPFYGFQIVALNSANTQAGTMTVSNAATTQINTLSSRQYMGHRNSNTTRNWTFKWTAPATAGTVTFYYSYNVCNASSTTPSNPEGTIYKGSVSIEGLLSGVEDISTKVSGLSIFPNPVTNEFGMSFDLLETNNVSSQLYSLDGKLVKELINAKTAQGRVTQNFDVSDMPAGIYMVKLNVGEASVTKKIIKQ